MPTDPRRSFERTLLDRIYEALGDGTGPSARIAQKIAGRPEAVLHMSTAELASLTGSGQASVVRFCRSLGFDGYRDFKIALSAEIEREKTARLHRETAPRVGDDDISLLSTAIQTSVHDSAMLLATAQIDDLARRIMVASECVIFGIGVSNLCSRLLATRLTWMGINAHTPDYIGMPSIKVRRYDARALAIGISYSGISEETKTFLDAAGMHGAHTVAVTTRANCPVAASAKEIVLLSQSGLWPGEGSSRLMPSFVLLSELLAQRIEAQLDVGEKLPKS